MSIEKLDNSDSEQLKFLILKSPKKIVTNIQNQGPAKQRLDDCDDDLVDEKKQIVMMMMIFG